MTVGGYPEAIPNWTTCVLQDAEVLSFTYSFKYILSHFLPDTVLVLGIYDAFNRHGLSGVCLFVYCLPGTPTTFLMRKHTHYVSLGDRLDAPG